MLEDLQELEKEVGTLVNWVAEMKGLIQNPYSNGLNVPKVLNDLGGYAADLTKRIDALETKAALSMIPKKEKEISEEPEEEGEKAESTSVKQ